MDRSHVNPVIVDQGERLTDIHKGLLNCNFQENDIKGVLDSIPINKSPGLDGFNSMFFKAALPIIKRDVCLVVNDFFLTGKILREINITSIYLTPKVIVPAYIGNFRPIACCSVLYKCISKLMCKKLSQFLPEIISPNQGAFVAGRSILHNLLMCQDIIKHYNRGTTRPSCMMKLDLKKAYDTFEWKFIEEIMLELGFPPFFVNLVMTCLSTTQYSILINGAPSPLIQPIRGLRQGDPFLLYSLPCGWSTSPGL